MRRLQLLFIALGLAGAAIAAACSDGTTIINIYGGLDGGLPSFDDDSGAQGGVGVVEGGAGTGSATGLPCDIQQLLEVRCIACHSASMRLLTYADLQAKAASNPKNTMAQESLARMKGQGAIMPPSPALPPTMQEIATFEAWVTAGAPMGMTCTNAVDGGGGGPNPYNTPTVCTSNKYWAGGNSMGMRPGEACQACHQKQGGPSYSIAGTIYPTAHEPKDCNGTNANSLVVIVTDKNNKVVNIPVTNSAGNFASSAALAAPFFVKVQSSKGTRPMIGGLTSGDCNSCHTEQGANGAPGRVMAP